MLLMSPSLYSRLIAFLREHLMSYKRARSDMAPERTAKRI